ncbi:MAG: YafY family protein [Bacteroidota bacterium]
MDTVKRFDRIVAILIQLQSKRVVKAQEMADRFQVSLRTIYRDIRSLEVAGVPIVSEAGIGYSIMEGYRLPPVMFSREEAGSFVAAEKLMQQFTDKSLGAHYESAMFKLKSVLRGSEKDRVEILESQVTISPAQVMFNKDIPNALEILFEGIAEKKRVYLYYESIRANTPLDREIEPVGVFNENNFWYVMGYCHLRNDYRQFRADRIQRIALTQHDFSMEHQSLDILRQKGEAAPKTQVKIIVDRLVAKFLQATRNNQGFVSERKLENGAVEMTFMSMDINDHFARWYLSFGDYAQILEPDCLKERVAELLKKQHEKLLSP